MIRQVTGDQVRIRHLGRLDQFTIHQNMQELVGLVFNGRYHIGMPVAGIADTDSPDGIQPFFSIRTKQVKAFCAEDLQRQWRRRSLSQVLIE